MTDEPRKIRTGSDILHCPLCKQQLVEQTDIPLENKLKSLACPGCGGNWIDAGSYWTWLESRPKPDAADAIPPADAAKLLPVADSGPGKFCPRCGRFLARAKPGHGLEFVLTRCGGCGGIWLDANEWANLKTIGLHERIHLIFSDSWQAEVAKAERERGYEQLLLERLGGEALAEIKRIKAWLDNHPKKNELYAFLTGAKDAPPTKR